MAIPNRNINYPTALKFGAGRIKELAEHCKANGISRPLFVTDKGLASMPMVAEIMDDLKKAGLKAELFSDVRPNPVEENVLAGCKAFTAGKHDGVVAFGGGSGLDTAKMIALMHAQTLSIFELEDIGDWWTGRTLRRSRRSSRCRRRPARARKWGAPASSPIRSPMRRRSSSIRRSCRRWRSSIPNSRWACRRSSRRPPAWTRWRTISKPIARLLSSAVGGHRARGHAAGEGEPSQGGEEGQGS